MIEKFKNAMQSAGVNPPSNIIADGKLHRFHLGGDKSGTLNGAYFLHLDDHANGWFSNWRGVTGKWSADGKAQPFTPAMRKQFEEDRKQREIEKQLGYQQAAKTAAFIWGQSHSSSQHPYLTRKKVRLHNARVYRDALTIPIYNVDRELVNLQFIQADGSKRFLSSAQKKSCFSVIKSFDGNTDVILICEGWATGASLNESTGRQVVIALDAGNLVMVARVIRSIYPGSEIIIAGDNDASGTGQKSAREAASLVFGKVLIPEQADSDWNDFITNGGTL